MKFCLVYDQVTVALPDAVENLLQIIGIKQLCRRAGVEKADAGPKGAVLTLHEDRFANPEGLVDYIQNQAGTAKLRPDQKPVFMRPWENSRERVRGVRLLMGELAELAERQSGSRADPG